MKIALLVYILTVVFANISVAFAPWMVYVNALVFIGLDLTLKDYFQVRLPPYALVLIVLTGSIITFLINVQFLPIAIASTAAFSVAFTIDFIVFHLLRKHVWYRVLLSNAFGSFADSFVFIFLAPFPFSWTMVLLTAALKIIGGSISAYILIKKGILT